MMRIPLQTIRRWLYPALLLLIFAVALPAAAQDQPITDDEVNAVANKLYCPVCENIPLDVCPTLACQEWRSEIRTLLGRGLSEQEVINDFVQRYGERVVGTPQDPMLRALSLVTPWVLGLIAAVAGAYFLLRWRTGQPTRTAAAPPEAETRDDEYYRARIEQDLMARR